MLEGAIEPKAIAKHARSSAFQRSRSTDRNGLYAAMAFGEACMARACSRSSARCWPLARPDDIGPGGKIDWLVLLAQDETGYDNLCRLVSAAHLDRPVHEEPHVPFDALEGCDRRADRADRGRGRGAGAAVRRRSGRQGWRLCRSAEGAVSRSALHRAVAPRRRRRRSGRSAAGRSGLCARLAAGRDQPGPICRAGLPRRA